MTRPAPIELIIHSDTRPDRHTPALDAADLLAQPPEARLVLLPRSLHSLDLVEHLTRGNPLVAFGFRWLAVLPGATWHTVTEVGVRVAGRLLPDAPRVVVYAMPPIDAEARFIALQDGDFPAAAGWPVVDEGVRFEAPHVRGVL